MNNTPISLELETHIIRVKVTVIPAAIGKGDCIGVIIQNTLTNLESVANPQAGNNLDVMLGGGTGQMYQMIPGQESPLYYALDLEDVYLRVRQAIIVDAELVDTTNVTVIVYRKRKHKLPRELRHQLGGLG